MTEINYSAMLRDLVQEYFDHRLTRVEYLTRRRELMNRIDRDFNGARGVNPVPRDAANEAADFSQYVNLPKRGSSVSTQGRRNLK